MEGWLYFLLSSSLSFQFSGSESRSEGLEIEFCFCFKGETRENRRGRGREIAKERGGSSVRKYIGCDGEATNQGSNEQADNVSRAICSDIRRSIMPFA